MFFFFKQKTAYEMRISDWSSDVCSSDLGRDPASPREKTADKRQTRSRGCGGFGCENRRAGFVERHAVDDFVHLFQLSDDSASTHPQIGRASCRESVCKYV